MLQVMFGIRVLILAWLTVRSVCFWRGGKRMQALGWACFVIGGTLNTIVIAANRGMMPVTNFHGEMSPGHVAANIASKLLFLADVYGPSWARYSIGDVIAFSGLMFWIPSILDRLSRDYLSSGFSAESTIEKRK